MEQVNQYLEPLFRWTHVVAGVLWIGLLYFFNWVNGPFAKTLDAETKKKALPELLPRALYFFRWGAAYTWISGILLLMLVYYHGKLMAGEAATMGSMALSGVGLASILVGAAVYDVLWKAMQKQEQAAVVVSFVLLAAIVAVWHFALHISGRALYIHIGALFGTSMAMNVWMRIWPAQRKIIAATKEGQAPDPALPALAGLRSKHNTYMSVPLIFMMVSNHWPWFYGHQDMNWIIALVVVVAGWIVTKLIYKKSTTSAPAQY